MRHDTPPTPAAMPLPERIRPADLGEVVGQEALLGGEGVLTRLIAAGRLPSLLLWGPPGCGKTTIARLIADRLGLRLAACSAVLSGVAELRALVDEAATAAALGQGTVLFIDEIHRFNKTQQDALLPHVERGTVLLIGATTENPAFSVVRALLSRCRVVPLAALAGEAIGRLIDRAVAHPAGLPGAVVEAAARERLVRLCAGDGRRALALLEAAHALGGSPVTASAVERIALQPVADHDRAGDSHYDVASAFIKSMRASDVQAAVYWLARQLEAGEDAAFVARRIVIFAAEDVGLADPQALVVASAAQAATERIGMPEALYPLTEAVIYCSCAPKSNATKAYHAAAAAVRRHPGARVPLFLRNAPTALARELGHGRGYVYDHDAPDHHAGQDCLPAELAGSVFYVPGEFGFEREIAKRLAWWAARRSPPRPDPP